MITLQRLSRIKKKIENDGASGLLTGAKAALRYRLIDTLLFDQFKWWERHGVHVTPVNRWSPIPDTRRFNQTLWSKPSELSMVDVREETQLDFLSTCRERYYDEYSSFPNTQNTTMGRYRYYTRNGTFETVDAEVLYCMVRECKPDRIIQAGGGFSTRVLARALWDGSIDCSVEVFQPHRDDWLIDNSPRNFNFINEWAESVDTKRFETLSPGDVLFVDSSHVLRIGNDVHRLLFDAIPRLSEGVLVHFHDVFLPYQYPKEWVLERNWFLNEQYALRAFLAFNDKVKVRWMGGYMHCNHPDALASAFESYDPSLVGAEEKMDVPNSIWLEITE